MDTISRADAAQARAASYYTAHTHERHRRAALPVGVSAHRQMPNPGESAMRYTLIDRNGKQFYHTEGYATVYGKFYEMWDMFGPYDERVNPTAGDITIANNPDVVFLINHEGLSLARTTAGSLELRNDPFGLHHDAWMNPNRDEVRNLALAMDDQLITEMSFSFMIVHGLWNENFDQFEITEYDIDRGDVSAVNYGANPYTNIAARQHELFAELRNLPAGTALEAARLLTERDDVRMLTDRTAASHDRAINLDALVDFARSKGAREDDESAITVSAVEQLLAAAEATHRDRLTVD